MQVVLALDQGTTSSRAIVFDHDGAIRAMAQQEFRQIFPQPGLVEHDPAELWSSQVQVAAEALAQAGCGAGDVAAIGITNQRETTLIWSRATGEPVANAIVWQDRRTSEHCARLKADGLEATFKQKTGLVLDPYFSGTKIAWLLDNIPGVRARAERGELAAGTIDSWLVWKLSSGRVYVTDESNASRTLLYNIHTHAWDPALLELLSVPASLLPEVYSSSELYAETSCDGLPQGVPIAGIAGDQQAALFGQLCLTAGMAKNTYGTGCFMLMNTGEEPVSSESGLLTTVAWRRGTRTEYALEGSVFIAGAVVQWLRDGLGLIDDASEVEALAASVPDSGGVFFVPAFTGLGAPWWDPYARGTIVGLTRGTTRAHVARAALESIALQTADVLSAMQADSALELAELRVDGGASANDLLMSIQANLLGVPVVRPRLVETTAAGAAYLAGLAVGFWKETDELAAHAAIDRRFEPQAAAGTSSAELLAGWRKAVARARGWAS